MHLTEHDCYDDGNIYTCCITWILQSKTSFYNVHDWNLPIYFGICVQPNVNDNGEYRLNCYCEYQAYGQYPIQTTRVCRECQAPLKVAAYNTELIGHIQAEIMTIYPYSSRIEVTKARLQRWRDEVHEDWLDNYVDIYEPRHGIRRHATHRHLDEFPPAPPRFRQADRCQVPRENKNFVAHETHHAFAKNSPAF